MKKAIINISFFAAAILFLGIPFIDLFLIPVKFPAVCLCVAGLALLAGLFVIIRKNKRKKLSVIYCVTVALIAALLLLNSCFSPQWNTRYFSQYYSTSKDYNTAFTSAEALEDVEELMYYLDRYHPAFIDGRPTETVEVLNSVIFSLAAKDSIKGYELRRELARICASLHDGHTSISTYYSNEMYLKDVWYKNAGGWTLDSVNGENVNDWFERSSDLFSFENESWGKQSFSSLLHKKSGLLFLGIDVNDFSLTWEKEGVQKTEYYSENDFVTVEQIREISAQLNQNSAEESYEWIHYDIDKENGFAVLSLNECNYNSELISVYNAFFTEVKEKCINNVIVDLRNNPGGNSYVADEFIRYLPVEKFSTSGLSQRFGPFMLGGCKPGTKVNEQYKNLLFEGSVYILTSNSTFSSAMMFAEYIKDNGLGIIVGETPGNAANGYGEINVQQLKNSGLIVSISTKYFIRASGDESELFVIPDIECSSREAMEKALEIINQQE